MDCFGNSGTYSDYRNGMMNGSGSNGVGGPNAGTYNGHHHNPYANYHHPSNMRLPHMPANYRNTNETANAMPYDRYGSYSATNHGYGNLGTPYNTTAYGYNPNSSGNAGQMPIDSRSNQFYAQHQHSVYDPYNGMAAATNNYASPSSHTQYAYHQRDFHSFESGAPYRTRGGSSATGNGTYMMRDSYQHPYVGGSPTTHCGDYMSMPSNGMVGNGVGNGVGNVSPSAAMLSSSGPKIGPQNHHTHSYQTMHAPNYGDFHKHLPMTSNQYVTDSNGFPPHPMIGGHPYMARENEKCRKSHRDRSLSKLVAMNRRLESQVSMMNECERLGTPFTDNYEYYTDYSATPDSTISAAGYGNVDQASSVESMTPRDASEGDASAESKINHDITACAKEADTKLLQNPVENQNSMSNCSQSPAKEKVAKKSNKNGDSTIIKKRRKRKDLKRSDRSDELDKKDEIKVNIIPLPGFQQAFGSTEIGRFSEIFFNFAESPVEPGIFESETDLSPLPWETGDSLEGPHFNLQPNIAGLTPAYAESYGSTDSPTASNNSYFGDVCTPEYS